MNEATAAVRRWPRLRDWTICLLLALAATHCVQSIFVVNASWMDLPSYENGTEKMPFQGRVAMMAVGRWASNSQAMKAASVSIKSRIFEKGKRQVEAYTPQKVAYLGVGLCATLLAVAFGVVIGRKLVPELWWLPSALFLYMLYVTYAARDDALYWYPYDLPHFALFGVAAVCVLRGLWPAVFLLFLVDLPVRETSIYLVPLMLAMGYARKQWRVVPWAAVMVVVWLVFRHAISDHFAANPSDTRIHWEFWMPAFRNPYRWGQLMSAFGFLVVPFVWGWKYLTREERLFVYGAVPGLAFTTLYGIWYETRIWDEWLLPAAVLMSLQAARVLAATGRPGAERGRQAAA